MKRKLMSRPKDSRVFRQTADKVHSKNLKPMVMRGGIRL